MDFNRDGVRIVVRNGVAPVDNGINNNLNGVAVRQQVDDFTRVACDLSL